MSNMNRTNINCYNTNIFLNHHIDHIGRVINKNKGFYEFGMLDYIYKNIKNGTFIDVGANIGNHTVFFSKFCANKVLAYEPILANYQILEKNVSDNNIENCSIFNLGISKDGRSFDGTVVSDNMGMCTLTEHGESIQTIKPLDIQLDSLKLLKIDCETMSMEIFDAFIPVIKKFRPHLFIEAEEKDLLYIEKVINYVRVQKFNATPTYHFKHR